MTDEPIPPHRVAVQPPRRAETTYTTTAAAPGPVPAPDDVRQAAAPQPREARKPTTAKPKE